MKRMLESGRLLVSYPFSLPELFVHRIHCTLVISHLTVTHHGVLVIAHFTYQPWHCAVQPPNTIVRYARIQLHEIIGLSIQQHRVPDQGVCGPPRFHGHLSWQISLLCHCAKKWQQTTFSPLLSY